MRTTCHFLNLGSQDDTNDGPEDLTMRECYLWQVKSSQLGGNGPFPGNIKGDDVAHPLHLMDDSIGVGHGVSVSQAWLSSLTNHSVNLSLHFF